MSSLCTVLSIACLTISVSAYTITVLLTRRWNDTRHQNDELTTRLLEQPKNEDRKLFHTSEETPYPNICIDMDMVLDGNELYIAMGFDRDPETGYATFL
jgi:hypothetical protein